MDENKVVALETLGAASKDALKEVLRQGTWRMLAQAIWNDSPDTFTNTMPVTGSR